MTHPRLRPFDCVVVTWEDACSDAIESFSSPADALASYKPVIRKTIGFWIGWAEKDGRVCAMLAIDDDRRNSLGEGRRSLSGPSQIPKGMIVEIDVLRVVARRH
jgi:hypothetical protein